MRRGAPRGSHGALRASRAAAASGCGGDPGPSARVCVGAQVWAVPTTMMQCNWLGERVATVDVDRAISNVINSKEDAGWGPNAVFRFPTSGGTGAIWKGVAKLLPADKQVRCVWVGGWVGARVCERLGGPSCSRQRGGRADAWEGGAAALRADQTTLCSSGGGAGSGGVACAPAPPAERLPSLPCAPFRRPARAYCRRTTSR